MPTAVNEEVAAALWLEDYLEADTTLYGLVNAIKYRDVSTRVQAPFVIIDRQDASDLMVVGLYRVWADLTFLVRGVTHGPDWDEVQTIADRIDALLHDHEEVSGTLHYHSFREESFTDSTIEDNELFVHAGGIYRVRTSAA